MYDNPKIQTEYKQGHIPKDQFRAEDSSKFKGKGRIIIKGYLNEAQRISEAISFNKYKIKGSMVIDGHDFRKPNKIFTDFL